MRLAFIAAVLLLGFTAAPASAQPTAVDDAFTRVVVTDDLAGGVAVVRDGAALTRFAAGHADVESREGFAPPTHVRVASITKTFVAATVLQLVAEGNMDLDAPIETYLPGRIRGEGIDANAITVRQLLRHQSGLAEYFDEDTPPPTEPATADQLLDMALTQPAQFPPGAEMKYTNTNYIIAGLLIEKVTGRPAADEITRRIIVPLGLFETYFPAAGDTGLRQPFAHGYEVVGGSRKDVTDFNASAAGMAGALVSINEDTSAFITALLDGRVVPGAQLEEMMETVPMTGGDGLLNYGLGLTSVSLPCGVTAWGHGGDIDGYHSLMLKPFDGPAISMTFTQSPPDTESIADDPRGIVLDALYCPA
ncbi:serine hydrolase domain-containing protein [Mycobacterium sp.]|uniref:serine hydrolase domain-containing protein n=1 Tax=Mycobacterium sp. TaxID=1785 RepID=UPI002D900537|nr:serine hydrolase domain-containing protein [Mycobacterium sp.]